eukprot:scpid43641/ scgid20861/ 
MGDIFPVRQASIHSPLCAVTESLPSLQPLQPPGRQLKPSSTFTSPFLLEVMFLFTAWVVGGGQDLTAACSCCKHSHAAHEIYREICLRIATVKGSLEIAVTRAHSIIFVRHCRKMEELGQRERTLLSLPAHHHAILGLGKHTWPSAVPLTRLLAENRMDLV